MRMQSFSGSLIAVGICLSTLAGASAQEPAGIRAGSAGEEWTPERLANAESRDMAVIPGLPEFWSAYDATDLYLFDEPASHEAQPPQEGITPDLEARLYSEDMIVEEPSAPFEERVHGDENESIDFGTSGALYSSSQLVPTDARLTYPHSTVGKLFFVDNGRAFVCSASVINRRIVLTAGHCVHRGNGDRTRAGFFTDFLFVPAFHQGQAPFGAWDPTWIFVTGSWLEFGSQNPINRADFGILVIGDQVFSRRVQPIGNVTGFLGFRTFRLASNHTKKLGYPLNFDGGQVMHQVDSQAFRIDDRAKQTVLYGGDMRGGSSGGPWVQDFGVNSIGQGDSGNYFRNRVVGVSSYVRRDQEIKVMGSSTLNDEFFNTDVSRLGIFQLACNQRAGNCR